MRRFARLQELLQLDPERDHLKIMQLAAGYEFPWDTVRALEIALYRTYCVPSISALLDRTGEFRERTQRRYDDTALLVAEMCKWGYDSGRGRQALERMNWIHSHFKIANADYLYVLSTFVYEPIRWIDSFGWRKLCTPEKLGIYFFWREVGTRMGIQEIPPSYAEFERFNRDYERDNFRHAGTNQRVGAATRDLFASWFPRLFAPLVRQGIYAMLDERMLVAFGFPRPFKFMPPLARFALRARGKFVRLLPPRRKPYFFADVPNRTYPQGYTIDELGPPRLHKPGTMP